VGFSKCRHPKGVTECVASCSRDQLYMSGGPEGAALSL
jgi:hypothetical protein